MDDTHDYVCMYTHMIMHIHMYVCACMCVGKCTCNHAHIAVPGRTKVVHLSVPEHAYTRLGVEW